VASKFSVLEPLKKEHRGSLFTDEQEQKDLKQFLSYISEYGKHYASDEEFMMRFKLFKETLRNIEAHPGMDAVGYSLGLTSLSDVTDEEYEKMTGYI